MKRPPRLELLCIGTELLSGRLNTHQRYLSLKLLDIGLALGRETSLPDERAVIADEMRRALRRSDVVLVSGGLGPTFDDVTRESAAAALRCGLTYRPSIYRGIEKKFARYRLTLPEGNKKQAMVLSGARVLPNEHGSAPGQIVTLPALRGGRPRMLILLPGPPSELEPLFERAVLPGLRRTYARGRHTDSMVLHLSGISESDADEKLGPLMKKAEADMTFTILASLGQVDFHARAGGTTPAAARRKISRVRAMAAEAVGRNIVGEGDTTLESAVGDLLRKKRLTLAVAESCTAGIFSARITKAKGSSDYFKGGVLSYANGVKTDLLGVSARTIARHGAVSLQCAREMADRARRVTRSHIGVSITGIAGPGGGTAAKPVGLVYIAIAGPGRAGGNWRLKLPGNRDSVRQRAAIAALHLLWRHLRRKVPR